MKHLVKSNGNFYSSMPSLMNDFFDDTWFDSSLSNWRSAGSSLPAINIKENNDEFEIEVAAPGMKRDDFKVELDNSLLTISSEREDKREEKDNEGNYTRREFSYQSFQRSFTLPQERVDADKIAARYTDGILHITVPKRESAKVKPTKQITIG